jgi:hypothetical protein
MSCVKRLAAVASVVAAIGVVVALRSSPSAGSRATVRSEQAVAGVHTARYEDGRLASRLDADAVSSEPVKLFGPFRLGFAQRVRAQDVRVETFDAADGPMTEPVAALLTDALASPVVASSGAVLAAEAAPVRVVRHAADGTSIGLEAAQCRSARAGAVTCYDGVLDMDGRSTPFRELSYDPRQQTTVVR